MRNDINATWIPPEMVPNPNVKYLDTYDYDFVATERSKIRDFFGTVVK